MATDTVPAAVPGPPDPPSNADTSPQGARGLLASMVAPVEPARPTFSLQPTLGDTQTGPDSDGILDRSTPGQSSASFRDTTDQAAKSNDPAGSRHKRSIWKEMWLAAATRWAKGGGTANKRLDLEKARAQANAYQVKETRTTTHMKSPGLPLRNTGGSGAGAKGDTGKSGGKGAANSSGNRSGGAGNGGSGGGRGPAGGAGSSGSNGNGRGGKPQHGAGADGKHAGGAGKTPTDRKTNGASGKDSGKGSGKTPAGSGGSSGAGGAGKPGASGSSGKAGKDGSPGKNGSSTDAKGHGGKVDLTKDPKNSKGATQQQTAIEKTPLQKSRETGHGDGSKVRSVVDHVKAYKDGAVDGYHDEKDKNAKEHDRLDKARADRKTGKDQPGTDKAVSGKPGHDPNGQATKDPNGQPAKDGGKPKPVTATTQGHTVLIEDDNAPLEDSFMGKATPIQAKGIDTTKITLGDGFRKTSVKRSELRRFKDYEGRLEARIDGFAKVVDATKALAAQAREQAEECQTLLEDAKGVKGGEKLVGELQRLTEQAKAQADEADEVHTLALKAHDFGKAVLANVQTRYQPLYQAVVDSDETKPAELKFYKDRGITPSDTALAA